MLEKGEMDEDSLLLKILKYVFVPVGNFGREQINRRKNIDFKVTLI